MLKQQKLKGDIDNEGHRIPPIPVYCDISKIEGVKITGLTEDIINYEVRDISTEIIIASFKEESEFIDFLFSQIGTYQVVLETNNFYISGDIEIE